MKTPKTLHNEQGFVLLVVYIVVILVTVFSIAFFARHRTAILTTERYQNRILAFNAAESGIDFALRGIAKDPDMTGTPPATNTPLEDPVFSTPYYTSAVPPTEQNAFQFQLFYVPDEPLRRRIESKGCAPSCTDSSRAYQTSNITVYCKITEITTTIGLFNYGVYSENSISLSGNSAFDSYNSNYGAYGGSNRSSDGAMAVNSTLAGKVSLSGNAKIKGDVVVGYNGVPNTVITTSGNASTTGNRSTLPEDWTSPPSVVVPTEVIPIDLSNVSGNSTRTLSPGTYRTSSLKTSGNGKIKTTGAVRIYVDGVIDITGNGIVVPNNHPENMLLFSTGSATVMIAGNGSFYGGVYAPQSAVTASGNGDIFGAVIAKTYTQSGNSATHFDLAMKNLTTTDQKQTGIVRITAWQELNSLAWETGKTIE